MKFFGYAGSAAGALADESLQRRLSLSLGSASSSKEIRLPRLIGACEASDFAEGGSVIVATRGGPFWIGNGSCAGRTPDTATSLLNTYLEHGIQLPHSMHGRFAVAIIDGRSGTVMLAVDPMGIERVAYALTPQGVVFGSSAEAIARFPLINAGLRQQALFDFLLLHIVPAPGTIFDRVFKLRPGTAAIYEHGKVRVERVWSPAFREHGPVDLPGLRSKTHSILRSAVADEQPTEATGAFLSGGLDSSTVAGIYSQVAGRPVHTFSMGFGEDQYDEIRFARIASGHFGTISHEHQVTPEDVIDAFPLVATAYDEPFGNSSAVPAFICARLAADSGMSTLLAGDGGDEIFAGNERYARQQVFEAYWRLPASLRMRVIEPLTRRLSPTSRFTLFRKLRSYIEQASIPMPERLEYWNFMFRADLGAMLERDFLDGIDASAPVRDMTETYEAAPSDSLLHRMLYFDWQYTLSDNDLRKVVTTCELAGVDVRFPMLHPDLVRLANELPPRVKLRGSRLRHFYKTVMAGFLPEEIINKKKHGFGLPFGIWLRTHQRFADLIYSLLTDLKSRRIVRAAFIDQLITDQRAGHASYFGYAIWDLAMLQAWLAAHS